MNATSKTIEKKLYSAPFVDYVKLDNEISLQLESAPPDGPNEGLNNLSTHFNSDPFKNDLG